MRKLLLNLHLYTALVAGLFIVILGVTGSIMTFETELDHVFNRSLFKVQPGPKPLSVVEVLNVLKTAYPHQKIGTLAMPSSPDGSYYASVGGGTTAFVNGYTGQIIGTRSGKTLLSQIHQLHLRLLIPGETGSNIEAVASFFLLWLVGSGLYLWWPLKRTKVKFGASMRRMAFDLHSAVGFYTCLFVFILALTGIVVHFDNSLEARLNTAAHVTPPLRTALSTVLPNVKPISPDQAVAIAQAALPGTKPSLLMLPAGRTGSYRVNSPFPEDLTGNRSWVLIDQYSGNVLFVESSRTAVFGTKAIIQNRAIHTGQIFGYPSKILMSLSSLMLVVMVITGYYMWWKKLRSGQTVKPKVVEAGPVAVTQNV